MNFYKHHIGDYGQATAHLSFVEDAAYSRMLRKYYAEEKPLPADLKAVQRLVAARTREEREAVALVLEEFFTLEADGWHNRRADAEIAKASAQAEANRITAANREERRRAQKQGAPAGHTESTIRASEEHESLNESLRSREPSQTPDTRHQTPDSRHQTPDSRLQYQPPPTPPTAAGVDLPGAVCRAMNRAGLADTNPADPRLLALLELGVTEAECEAAAREAAGKGKGWAWTLAVLERQRREAAAIAQQQPMPVATAAATMPNDAAEQTRAYLDAQLLTREQAAAAEEARVTAMQRLRRPLTTAATSTGRDRAG